MRFIQEPLESFLVQVAQLLKDGGWQIEIRYLTRAQSHPLQLKKMTTALLLSSRAVTSLCTTTNNLIVMVHVQDGNSVGIAITKSIDWRLQRLLQMLDPLS
jgi:hypothetical protein